MLEKIRAVLVITLLAVGCWAVVEAALAIDGAREAAKRLSAVASSAALAVSAVRKAAAEQEGYYRDSASKVKAAAGDLHVLAKNLAELTEPPSKRRPEGGLLYAAIARTDANLNGKEGVLAHLELLERNANTLLGNTDTALNDDDKGLLPNATAAVVVEARNLSTVLETTNQQEKELGHKAANLFDALGGISLNVEKNMVPPAIGTLDHLNKSAESIELLLNPAKPPFWKRVLMLLIPRPTIGAR